MEAVAVILFPEPVEGKPAGRGAAVFDIDALIADCRGAVDGPEPHAAVKEVLQRALRDPRQVAAALGCRRSGITVLHADDVLTVLDVVWAPRMRFRPHNHLMWAAIGLYAGQEDNTFYRRSGPGLAVSGHRELRESDVALLGDDVIHAVRNPRDAFTGAIHVYGGDLPGRAGRSEWDDDTGAEVAYDFERTRRYFEEADSA
jgi:predicted metal-dependent enzyme (double-stranded beta helix superfamily)